MLAGVAASIAATPTAARAQRPTPPASTVLPRLVPPAADASSRPAAPWPGARPAPGDGWSAPLPYGSWPDPWGPPSAGGRLPRRVRPVLIVVGPALAWSTGAHATGAHPPSDAVPPDSGRRAPGTRVIEVGRPARPDADALAAEPLGGGLLRVRWSGDGGARGVTLFVADSARRVVAAQTVHAPPFTAVFDRGAGAAFVGATVARADGGSTTTLVPRAARR